MAPRAKKEEVFNKPLFLKYYSESLSVKEAVTKMNKKYFHYSYAISNDIEFKKAVDKIQQAIVSKAIDNISKAIDEEDINTSKWLLEKLDSRFHNNQTINLITEPTNLLDGIIEQTKNETE
jgi:hypothetical protein